MTACSTFRGPTGERLKPFSSDHDLREVLHAVSYLGHAHQTAIQTRMSSLCPFGNRAWIAPMSWARLITLRPLNFVCRLSRSGNQQGRHYHDPTRPHVMVGLCWLLINTFFYKNQRSSSRSWVILPRSSTSGAQCLSADSSALAFARALILPGLS